MVSFNYATITHNFPPKFDINFIQRRMRYPLTLFPRPIVSRWTTSCRNSMGFPLHPYWLLPRPKTVFMPAGILAGSLHANPKNGLVFSHILHTVIRNRQLRNKLSILFFCLTDRSGISTQILSWIDPESVKVDGFTEHGKKFIFIVIKFMRRTRSVH